MSSPANVSCVCLGSWFGKLRLWNPWSSTSIGIHTSSHVCMRCRSSFPTLADATVSSRSASNKTSASKNLGQVVGFGLCSLSLKFFDRIYPSLSWLSNNITRLELRTQDSKKALHPCFSQHARCCTASAGNMCFSVFPVTFVECGLDSVHLRE